MSPNHWIAFSFSSWAFNIHGKPISLIRFSFILHLDTLAIRTNLPRQNSHSLHNDDSGNIVSKRAFRPDACNSLKEQCGDVFFSHFLSSVFPRVTCQQCHLCVFTAAAVLWCVAESWHCDFRGLLCASPKKHTKKSQRKKTLTEWPCQQCQIIPFFAKSQKLPRVWTSRQRRAVILEMQGLRVVRLRGPRANGLASLVAAGHLVISEVKAE